ncbi:MAG: hypothetical protein V3U03_08505 [Myxococcota bacterium]
MGFTDLEQLVAGELFAPPPEAATRFAAEIRRRHGDSVAAVLFYGSCLRKRTSEGVLDFYALVDSYRSAYPSRRLAWANALLPPNVFYLEIESPEGTLRAKYAVMSTRDFARGVRPGGLRSGLWGRFCQPASAAYARDGAPRDIVARGAAESIVTLAMRVVPLLPAAGGEQRFTSAEFWQRALRETYSTEMRPEAPGAIRSIYDAAPDRYERALRGALDELARRGWLSVRREGGQLVVVQPRGRRLRARLGWWLRRPAAKLAYAAQLFKTAATFGDWLPYVLWKLERHTGTRIVPSERQLRHPFVWGWPILFRVLWRRDLR